MRSTQYKSMVHVVSRQSFVNLVYYCTGRALFSAVTRKSSTAGGEVVWGLDIELDKEVFKVVNEVD
jgi:hypothetical protein